MVAEKQREYEEKARQAKTEEDARKARAPEVARILRESGGTNRIDKKYTCRKNRYQQQKQQKTR